MKFIADDSYSYDEIRNIVHLYNTGELYEDAKPGNPFIRDYIVTQKNDTVFCRIKNDYFKGYFTYKETGKNDFIKIDTAFVKSYFYSRKNSIYTLAELPDRNHKEFVKWLENGAINLFEWTRVVSDPKKQIKKYYWYISKDSTPLIPIKIDVKSDFDLRSDSARLQELKNAFSDNRPLLKEFENDLKYVDNRFTNSNTDFVVRLYIKQYNQNQSKNKHLTAK